MTDLEVVKKFNDVRFDSVYKCVLGEQRDRQTDRQTAGQNTLYVPRL